jgi:DnaK suppressor protein
MASAAGNVRTMFDEPGAEESADFDRGRDLPALVLIERELAAVDAALVRLEDGTYGQCERCGGSLADEALAADPMIRRCPAHPDLDDDEARLGDPPF